MSADRDISISRLIFEGTAIVISILLAFAIDAWWDERRERVREGEILLALQADFKANREEAAAVIALHVDTANLFTEFRSMQAEVIAGLSPEKRSAIVAALVNPATYDPVRGTLDMLLGGGNLDLISDPELHKGLVSYTYAVDDALDDANFMTQTALPVWNAMIKAGGPWAVNFSGDASTARCKTAEPDSSCRMGTTVAFLTDPSHADVLRIKDDSELLGKAALHHFVGSGYTGELRRVLDQIDLILAILDEDLR